MKFHKYQGTGNDFIMIDDRSVQFPYHHDSNDQSVSKLVASLCDRKFGIGADGLILIRNHEKYDFEMIYFNADGSQSLCGNGSRCAVRFAQHLQIINDNTLFLAIDGPHEASIESDLIHLKMNDVAAVESIDNDLFIDTGSPHFIKFVEGIKAFDVYEEGKAIRFNSKFKPGGTNVNFVEKCGENEIFVRTYERGVEDETLSCGTGVTAASLAASERNFTSPVKIRTLGGSLQVAFNRVNEQFFNEIYLIGPAGMVFEGEIAIEMGV